MIFLEGILSQSKGATQGINVRVAVASTFYRLSNYQIRNLFLSILGVQISYCLII